MYRTLYNILGCSWTPCSNHNFGNPNLYFILVPTVSTLSHFSVESFPRKNSLYVHHVHCTTLQTLLSMQTTTSSFTISYAVSSK